MIKKGLGNLYNSFIKFYNKFLSNIEFDKKIILAIFKNINIKI